MIRRMQEADPTFFLYFQLVGPLAKVRRVHETRDYVGVICTLEETRKPDSPPIHP